MREGNEENEKEKQEIVNIMAELFIKKNSHFF